MATETQFQNALAKVDAETTKIGEYIKKLVAMQGNPGLTEAQEEAILAGLNAAADRLVGVGHNVEQPVPPTPLPPLPEV